MNDVENMLIDVGCVGADKVTISAGGKSTEMNAKQLWAAIASSKARDSNQDRLLAMFAIVREFDVTSEALKAAITLLAATVVAAEPEGHKEAFDRAIFSHLVDAIGEARKAIAEGLAKGKLA